MSRRTTTRQPTKAHQLTDAPRSKPHNKPIVDQRRPRWGLIVAAVAVIVCAAAVTVALIATRRHSGISATGDLMPAAVTGAVTNERPPQRVTDSSGIPGVLAWDTHGWPGDGSTPVGSLQHQHVSGPVDYSETPPVGGPHNAIWLNAGIYARPVPSERAVHDLEHGAVWITYDPTLPASEVQALRDFVLKQRTLTTEGSSANRYIVMSPWSSDALPAPIVISSWGHQLRLTSPADTRLQRFVDVFRSSTTFTPEPGEAVDGVPIRIGGRPLDMR